MSEGHAQEIKTQALALQVGKRLRILMSDNNAGIDDSLIGGVIHPQVRRRIGWSISGPRTAGTCFRCRDGNDYEQIVTALKKMEDVGSRGSASDDRDRQDHQGLLAGAVNGKIPALAIRWSAIPSHPYAMKMNSEYFVSLAETFEKHYGVEFEGIRDGAVTDPRERLIQFKTNIDVVMSVLDQQRAGRLAGRAPGRRSATGAKTTADCAST